MKLTTKLLGAALLFAFSFNAMATDPNQNESVARILPHKDPGFVKVLYINPNVKKVTVAVYGIDGLITKDVVRKASFDDGFTKVYDFNKLESGEYVIEITDGGKTVSYRLKYNEHDNAVYASSWENFGQRAQAVSAKK